VPPRKGGTFCFAGTGCGCDRANARTTIGSNSAADLRFLQWLLRIRNRNFKSKAALALKFASALCFPKFV
jgi:hypothetical protein